MVDPTPEEVFKKLKESYKSIDFRTSILKYSEIKLDYIVSIIRFSNQTKDELNEEFKFCGQYNTEHFETYYKILEHSIFLELWNNIVNFNKDIRIDKPTFYLSDPNRRTFLKDKTEDYSVLFLQTRSTSNSFYDYINEIEAEAYQFHVDSIYDLIDSSLEINFGGGNTSYLLINFPIYVDVHCKIKKLNSNKFKLTGQIKFNKIYNKSNICIVNHKKGGIGRDTKITEEQFQIIVEESKNYKEDMFVKDFNYEFLGPNFEIFISNIGLINKKYLIKKTLFYSKNVK